MLAKHRIAVARQVHGARERLGKSVHDRIAPAELPRPESFDPRNTLFIRHLIKGGLRNIEAQRIKGCIEADCGILV